MNVNANVNYNGSANNKRDKAAGTIGAAQDVQPGLQIVRIRGH